MQDLFHWYYMIILSLIRRMTEQKKINLEQIIHFDSHTMSGMFSNFELVLFIRGKTVEIFLYYDSAHKQYLWLEPICKVLQQVFKNRITANEYANSVTRLLDNERYKLIYSHGNMKIKFTD